jgi:hypothetical protein
MGEGYVRIWVRGGDDLADEVLARWDQDWFDRHVGKDVVTYIGSARMGHESGVPARDRCHILLGLRGEEDRIRDADGELREEPEVLRTEIVLVQDFIVNRPAPPQFFELIPDGQA